MVYVSCCESASPFTFRLVMAVLIRFSGSTLRLSSAGQLRSVPSVSS